jgi:hypothetical protein
MKLSQFKKSLEERSILQFRLPDGQSVPDHFHITEVGLTTKHFIDCGGKVRVEKTVNFQLWVANDTDHRLTADKLGQIIEKAMPLFRDEDPEVEFEYQQQSITRYGLSLAGEFFRLKPLLTNCLADDHCGIPQEKMPLRLADLGSMNTPCCSTGQC